MCLIGALTRYKQENGEHQPGNINRTTKQGGGGRGAAADKSLDSSYQLFRNVLNEALIKDIEMSASQHTKHVLDAEFKPS